MANTFLFVWSPSSFKPKTHRLLGEDLFFLVFTYFWTENPQIVRRRPFFFWSSHTFGLKTHSFCNEDLFNFFLVCTYFWTEKGCHHEIPPSVPPSLATPQQALLTFVHFLEYHEVQRSGLEPNNNLNCEQNYLIRSSQCEQAYCH